MTTTKLKTPKKPSKGAIPPAEDALRKALATQPDATAADLAAAAGLGRSTASKTLARLERAGQVRRHQGGRDGARRLPDRWTLATTAPALHTTAEQDREPAENGTPAANHERLKPGQLEGLILTYMQEHPTEPLGPGAIAKALQRSSGAVGNGLARLTRAKKVRQVNDKPRRYQIAA
jgi:DNA-binding transcriptional ArsR family regulator